MENAVTLKAEEKTNLTLWPPCSCNQVALQFQHAQE